MSSEMSKPMHDLVRDLVGEFTSVAPRGSDRSLGIVGPKIAPAQIPAHCLRSCLGGDPAALEQNGCAWLRGLARGETPPPRSDDSRCDKGHRVAAQAIDMDEMRGWLVAVGDETLPASADLEGVTGADEVLTRLGSLSQSLERVGQILSENEGLADEVLRRYEQLNLIFDFTQEIASYTDPNEIERVLLRRIGELLSAHTILVLREESQYLCFDVFNGELVSDGDAAVLMERFGDEIRTLRRTKQVTVQATKTAHVILGPLERLDDRVDVVLGIRDGEAPEFDSGDMLMIESLLSFGGQIISNVEIHERLRRISAESTRALVAAIDKKDHYTSGHSERVGLLSRLVGERLGVSAADLQALEMSGLLHDIGKIGIPEGILCKPGRLTTDEYEIIKNHPRMGYEILQPIASFNPVLEGVLYHHENPDGTGYPDGLAGNDIPLFARIIHVVDVFDALTSTRSYRVAFTIEQACEILRKESGTKLDSAVVDAFLELLPTLRSEWPEQFGQLRSEAQTDEQEVATNA